jgi:hypothetical protein
VDDFKLVQDSSRVQKRFKADVLDGSERTRQGVLFIGANDKRGQNYLFGEGQVVTADTTGKGDQ